MTNSWTMTIPVHRQYVLNSNDRHSHWSQRSEPTKVLRQLGAAAARRAGVQRMERALVLVEVLYPSKARLRDVYNLYPTAKALVDGMVAPREKGGADMLPDDNDKHLTGPDMRRGVGSSGAPDRYIFTVTVTEA